MPSRERQHQVSSRATVAVALSLAVTAGLLGLATAPAQANPPPRQPPHPPARRFVRPAPPAPPQPVTPPFRQPVAPPRRQPVAPRFQPPVAPAPVVLPQVSPPSPYSGPDGGYPYPPVAPPSPYSGPDGGLGGLGGGGGGGLGGLAGLGGRYGYGYRPDPDGGTKPSLPAWLVGTWECDGGDKYIQLQFNPDGSYTKLTMDHSLFGGGQSWETGTWTETPGDLTLTHMTLGGEVTEEFGVKEGSVEMELNDGNHTTAYVKRGK